jgi:hypothetical protein
MQTLNWQESFEVFSMYDELDNTIFDVIKC